MSNRREFISLLGGAAAWPLAVRAQQGERMRRIGVLMAINADDAEAQARIAAFVRGLQQLGWTVGKNVSIDYRFAGIDADTLRKYAAELVALARLMMTILGGLAEFERELILARTSDGRTRAKARGLRFGRPPSLRSTSVRKPPSGSLKALRRPILLGPMAPAKPRYRGCKHRQ
jgi:DNA invertase Pin-like site-specific DNA recombinase